MNQLLFTLMRASTAYEQGKKLGFSIGILMVSVGVLIWYFRRQKKNRL